MDIWIENISYKYEKCINKTKKYFTFLYKSESDDFYIVKIYTNMNNLDIKNNNSKFYSIDETTQPLYNNLVKYIDNETSKFYLTIRKYINGMSIEMYIQKYKATRDMIEKYILFMIDTIANFEKYNLSHQNIKSTNIIILNEEFILIDQNNMKNHIFIKPEYTEPWFYINESINYNNILEHDIFSLMICLYLLANRKYCFDYPKNIINYMSYNYSNSGWDDIDIYIDNIFLGKKFNLNALKTYAISFKIFDKK